MTDFTEASLKAIYDFEEGSRLIAESIDDHIKTTTSLLRFVARYASWNGKFGSAVSTLAGKIGRSRSLFMDPSEPITMLADRSVFVASFFFDAARDEFDDRDTEHRDTHRCLAQAVIAGLVKYGQTQGEAGFDSPERINALLKDPLWLTALHQRTIAGYTGGSSDDIGTIFRAIGYHLGSEVLADQEFSIIDSTLREKRPELVTFLENETVHINGEDHNAFQWIRIHSGHGGGAEADHFDWATRGADLAYAFTDKALHPALTHQLHEGYLQFARDHQEFFAQVG